MDVQTALNLLDQNVANLNGTRESHVELQQAIAVLQNLIDKTVENAKKSGLKAAAKAAKTDKKV